MVTTPPRNAAVIVNRAAACGDCAAIVDATVEAVVRRALTCTYTTRPVRAMRRTPLMVCSRSRSILLLRSAATAQYVR
jgi:hypothetical protein